MIASYLVSRGKNVFERNIFKIIKMDRTSTTGPASTGLDEPLLARWSVQTCPC